MGDSEYGVTHNRLRIESQLNIIVRMTRSNPHVKICHLVGDSRSTTIFKCPNAHVNICHDK